MKIEINQSHCEKGEWGYKKLNPVDLALQAAGLSVKAYAAEHDHNYNVSFEAADIDFYERIAISDFAIAQRLGEQMWCRNVIPQEFEIKIYAANSQQQPENPSLRDNQAQAKEIFNMLYSSQELSACLIVAGHAEKDVDRLLEGFDARGMVALRENAYGFVYDTNFLNEVTWDLRYANFTAAAQTLETILMEVEDWQAEDSLELAF